MRLFAAFVPSEEVVEDLTGFLEPRREAGGDLRWVDPDQWHLTLAFMPDVPDRALDRLTEALAQSAARHTPARLSVEGGGAFPNPYAARVLFAGIASDQDALTSLAASVRGAANRAGAAPEGGPFHAHLTVARWRRPAEATKWIRVLDGYAGPAWTAPEIVLVQSHLGEGRRRRPRHEVLDRFALGTAA
jgi:2'-5' RNA ligase